MDKDAIAFLDGETESEAEETEEVEAQEAETEAEAAPEPEPKETEAEEQTGEEDPGSTPEPEPQKQHDIPVTALLDEREKRQAAQRQLEEYQRRERELQAQLQKLQQPKQEAPDWYEDPQAAARYQTQTIEQQFQARLMQQSKFLAEREFGQNTVNEAISYFDRNPAASQQFKDHPSPFHAAVEFYQRQKVAEEIGSDPEAYKQKLRDELRAELEAELTANPKAKPKAPPPSMASAPAAGKEAITSGSAFDQLFPD